MWLTIAAAFLTLVIVHDFVLSPHGPHAAAPTTTRPALVPPPSSTASAPTTPPPTVTISPPTSTRPLPREPLQLTGLTTPSAGVAELLLGGNQPAWLSLATGRSTPIQGLPPDPAGYGLQRVIGGWTAERSTPLAGLPNCNMCAGSPEPVYFIPNGSPAATPVGVVATQSAAAATGGAIWLSTFRAGANTTSAAAVAREVSLSGQPLSPQYRLPGGYVIQQAVGGDLLLAATSQGPNDPNAYELWNPRSGRVVGSFAEVIAASPDQLAFLLCSPGCPIAVDDPATGRSASIPLPHGSWPLNTGTYTDDGRFLAVQISAAVAPDGESIASRLGVIDLATDRFLPVPGSVTSTNVGVGFGWQAGTDCLVAAVQGRNGVVQLASWEIGAPHLLVAPVHLTGARSDVVLGDFG